MRDYTFTVIVTSYNNGTYLNDCLKSVVGQTGDDIEIIIVDDASTDSSLQICETYATADSRVRIIRHEQNRKVSAARNTGIENARGKWITFVDGDDMLTENAVERMRKYARSEAELVIFHAQTTKMGVTAQDTAEFQAETLQTENDLKLFRNCILDCKKRAERFQNLITYSVWCKLWKRSFLQENHLRFDLSLPKGQDVAFEYLCAHYCSCVELVPETTYLYRMNENGICTRFQEDILDKATRMIYSIRRMADLFQESDDREFQRLYLDWTYYLLHDEIFALGIYHPDCTWKKEDRLAWLDQLCGLDWVREICAHDHAAPCKSFFRRVMVRRLRERELNKIDRDWQLLKLLRKAHRRIAIKKARTGTQSTRNEKEAFS